LQTFKNEKNGKTTFSSEVEPKKHTHIIYCFEKSCPSNTGWFRKIYCWKQ